MQYPLAVKVRIFLAFAFGYFLSYALRAVNAAIAPNLEADLAINAAQLGQLTSAYLLAFALVQWPLGIWLDKYGARRTESALLLVAATGAFVFAFANSWIGLWIGRALIGAGVSGCLMAAYKGFQHWFAPQEQSRLAAYMLVAGTSGVLATTIPVQWLVEYAGWRPAFMAAGVLLMLASAGLYFGLPTDEIKNTDRPLSTVNSPSNWTTGHVLREPYVWRMSLIWIVYVGGFIALQSLWVGPWMNKVLGYSPARTAEILFVFNLFLMLGYFALGSFQPRLEGRGYTLNQLVIAFNSVGLLALSLIVIVADSVWWWLWLFLAVSTTINTVVQPRVALLFPAVLNGRANATFNLMIFGGAFFWQWGFGVQVELFRSIGFDLIQAYRATLGLYTVIAFMSMILFWFWQPPEPKFPD